MERRTTHGKRVRRRYLHPKRTSTHSDERKHTTLNLVYQHFFKPVVDERRRQYREQSRCAFERFVAGRVYATALRESLLHYPYHPMLGSFDMKFQVFFQGVNRSPNRPVLDALMTKVPNKWKNFTKTLEQSRFYCVRYSTYAEYRTFGVCPNCRSHVLEVNPRPNSGRFRDQYNMLSKEWKRSYTASNVVETEFTVRCRSRACATLTNSHRTQVLNL